MQIVDFHCHTEYSKDSIATLQSIIYWMGKKNVDQIAITDHNTTRGAVIAHQLAPEKFIIGEEIKTKDGEILAFFVQEEVPAGLSAEKTISMLLDQGAFISISHPFDYYRNGHWKLSALKANLAHLDAIEVFNARCMSVKANEQALAFALENNLPCLAGSDAHSASEIGNAALVIPEFFDAKSLRKAIHQSHTRGKLTHPFVHLTSLYARWKKSVRKSRKPTR